MDKPGIQTTEGCKKISGSLSPLRLQHISSGGDQWREENLAEGEGVPSSHGIIQGKETQQHRCRKVSPTWQSIGLAGRPTPLVLT